MSDRTKQILIITAAIVAIVIGVLIYIGQHAPSFQTVKCPGGGEAIVVDADRFLLEYSGKQVTLDAALGDKLKVRIGVGDQVLQQAISATQLLDQRLRVLVMEQQSSACDTKGKDLLKGLGAYSSNEFSQLLKLSNDLNEIAAKGDTSQKANAEKVLDETQVLAASAAKNLGESTTSRQP